jgi:hypothetical protein
MSTWVAITFLGSTVRAYIVFSGYPASISPYTVIGIISPARSLRPRLLYDPPFGADLRAVKTLVSVYKQSLQYLYLLSNFY